MENKKDKITYDDFVEEHQINSYKHLLDIININTGEDIRENFIFRGIKKSSYDLLPSSLRFDEETKDWKINKYIVDSDFVLNINRRVELNIGGKKQIAHTFSNINKSNDIVRKKTKRFRFIRRRSSI